MIFMAYRARRDAPSRFHRRNRQVRRYGKPFRTRAGKYGRYVYQGGKRIIFQEIRKKSRLKFGKFVRRRIYR